MLTLVHSIVIISVLARCTEVFGERFGGTVIGTVALSDLVTTAVIRVASKLILGGQQKDYLYYFLFAAFCGPAIGFLVTMITPNTQNDIAKKKAILKCCKPKSEDRDIKMEAI